MDLVANLTSTLGLEGSHVNEVYFRLRSNHTNLLGLDFDEIETYYDNLHQHLAIKSVILLGSPMLSLLHDIDSYMSKISGYFLIMQFPILILSLFLIKINIYTPI